MQLYRTHDKQKYKNLPNNQSTFDLPPLELAEAERQKRLVAEP